MPHSPVQLLNRLYHIITEITLLTIVDLLKFCYQLTLKQSYFSDNVLKSIYDSPYDNCRYVVKFTLEFTTIVCTICFVNTNG